MMCKPDETPCDKPEQGSARTGRRLSRLLASVAGCGALASCSLPTMGFLAPRGPAASDTRELFIRVTLWMLIVVVPAMVLAPFFAWRYRLGKKGVSYKPNWAFSWPLEIIIWGVPMVIVAFLGVFQLCFAYILFARGLRGVSAVDGALLSLLEPVLNPVWTFLLTRETPSHYAVLGGSVILGATLLKTFAAPAQEAANAP